MVLCLPLNFNARCKWDYMVVECRHVVVFSAAPLINLRINSLSNDVKLAGLIRDSGESQ